MANERRPLCAEVSRADAESMAATASRVDRWILLEYRGLWNSEPLPGSTLGEELKAHLRRQAAALPRTKLLFIRRPERRRDPGLRVFFGTSPERGERFHALDLENYDELLDLDLSSALAGDSPWPGGPLDHPLLLVCTHGKHDRCCAKYGRPLYEALCEQAEEHWVWHSSHLGGDRFAGNVVVLPQGLYFGRAEGPRAWTLLDEYLAGRIYLDGYRGRSCYPFPVQAAEQAIRVATGSLGIADLTLAGSERQDEVLSVRFSIVRTGELYEVDVRAVPGELTHLTCNTVELRRPRHFVAGEPRVAAAR